MEFGQLLNENVSKKMGIAIVGVLTLAHLEAPPVYILILAAMAVVVQGILDFMKSKGEQK